MEFPQFLRSSFTVLVPDYRGARGVFLSKPYGVPVEPSATVLDMLDQFDQPGSAVFGLPFQHGLVAHPVNRVRPPGESWTHWRKRRSCRSIGFHPARETLFDDLFL